MRRVSDQMQSFYPRLWTEEELCKNSHPNFFCMNNIKMRIICCFLYVVTSKLNSYKHYIYIDQITKISNFRSQH